MYHVQSEYLLLGKITDYFDDCQDFCNYYFPPFLIIYLIRPILKIKNHEFVKKIYLKYFYVSLKRLIKYTFFPFLKILERVGSRIKIIFLLVFPVHILSFQEILIHDSYWHTHLENIIELKLVERSPSIRKVSGSLSRCRRLICFNKS